MLRVPFAYDETRELIHAENAVRRAEHRAPNCGHRVFRRVSSKGNHHFYHRDVEVCTTGESDIHFATKHLIKKGIDDHQKRGEPYLATITCGICGETEFSIDLSVIADSVEVEKQSLDKYIPDVSLCRDGRLVAGIEVVVSNPISQEKANAYRSRFTPALIVKPKESDLSSLDKRLKVPQSLVAMCDQCERILDTPYPNERRWLALEQGFYRLRNLPSPFKVVEPKPQITAEVKPTNEPETEQTRVPEIIPGQLSMSLESPVEPPPDSNIEVEATDGVSAARFSEFLALGLLVRAVAVKAGNASTNTSKPQKFNNSKRGRKPQGKRPYKSKGQSRTSTNSDTGRRWRKRR